MRTSSLRRSRAKKPRLPVPEPNEDGVALPPPTPIPTLQLLGEALQIPPEDLTVAKLMAGPECDDSTKPSNDD